MSDDRSARRRPPAADAGGEAPGAGPGQSPATDAPPGWRWLVEPGVEPEPDALAELVAARALAPRAVLVASRVVLPDGSLDPASAPWPRILDKPAMVDAARAGLLALRAARPGSLLVRDELARALEAAPRARALALTAAALSGEGAVGVLAPRSVAVRRAPALREGLRERLALLRAPHWTRDERLWQLLLLARGM